MNWCNITQVQYEPNCFDTKIYLLTVTFSSRCDTREIECKKCVMSLRDTECLILSRRTNTDFISSSRLSFTPKGTARLNSRLELETAWWQDADCLSVSQLKCVSSSLIYIYISYIYMCVWVRARACVCVSVCVFIIL